MQETTKAILDKRHFNGVLETMVNSRDKECWMKTYIPFYLALCTFDPLTHATQLYCSIPRAVHYIHHKLGMALQTWKP